MITIAKKHLINTLFFVVLTTSILCINYQNINIKVSIAWLLHGFSLGLTLFFMFKYQNLNFISNLCYKTIYFSTLGFTLLFPLGLVLNEPSSLFKTTASIYILFLIILLLITQKDQNNTKELPDHLKPVGSATVIVTLLGANEIGMAIHSYLFS